MKEIEIIVDGKVLSRVHTGLRASEVSRHLAPYSDIYMVYDANVAAVAKSIEAASEIKASTAIPATEDNKTMDTVLAITEWLLDHGANRNALLLAVGGGITTDMAGFAASVYKRGIRFAFVPTTLLSQVDAAIGGKTGVNFLNYKNMLGVIRQPEFTFVCSEVLETLPYRDFLSGAAELLKTFIIEDHGEYETAVRILSGIRQAEDYGKAVAGQRDGLSKLIGAAAGVKAGVVSRDQFENGERRNLNLGHTFAHAIEHEARAENGSVTHGEAVAMGIILAARLAERTGVAGNGFATKLEADFKACGLPTESPYPVASLAEAMGRDKKAEGGVVRFILPAGIGKVVTCEMTAEDAVSKL